MDPLDRLQSVIDVQDRAWKLGQRHGEKYGFYLGFIVGMLAGGAVAVITLLAVGAL